MRSRLYPKSPAPSFNSFTGAELQVNMPRLETRLSSRESHDMANKPEMFLGEQSINRLLHLKDSCKFCNHSFTVMRFKPVWPIHFPSTVALTSHSIWQAKVKLTSIWNKHEKAIVHHHQSSVWWFWWFFRNHSNMHKKLEVETGLIIALLRLTFSVVRTSTSFGRNVFFLNFYTTFD